MKARIIESMKFHEERQNGITVVYDAKHKKCSGEVKQIFYLLDRYPMSKEIFGLCPACKQSIIAKITDPIIFHHIFENKDFTLNDLAILKFSDDHFQFEYIDYYQKEFFKL